LEKKKVIVKTIKGYLLRNYKKILRQSSVQMIIIDNNEEFLMREVNDPQMFLKKMAYPKENTILQFKNKENPRWIIMMMEERRTILREI
jgi:hypothetical protein